MREHCEHLVVDLEVSPRAADSRRDDRGPPRRIERWRGPAEHRWANEREANRFTPGNRTVARASRRVHACAKLPKRVAQIFRAASHLAPCRRASSRCPRKIIARHRADQVDVHESAHAVLPARRGPP